jgi:hypothetical protein
VSGRLLSAHGLAIATGAASARRVEADPDDEPATVVATDPEGAFHFLDLPAGRYVVTLRATGHTAQRLRIDVPHAASVALPPIQLSPECHVRARFVSPAGSPVQVTRVVGRSFDLRGAPLSDARGEWTPVAVEDGGTVLIGPLQRGITVLGIDVPGLARTRLPDVRVSGADAIIDVGTVVVTRGADLQVRVVDASGAPQEHVRVRAVDTAPLSLVGLVHGETNAEGIVSFDRLGRGTYRLVADGDFPCGRSAPRAERLVDIPAEGARQERLVIGGAAVTIRVTRQGAPVSGAPVTLEPVRPTTRRPAWLASASWAGPDVAPYAEWTRTYCTGPTDGEGRVALSNVPFGPTRVTVALPSASWSTVVSIPIGGRAFRVDVPGEAVAVRVSRDDTGAPVPDADVGWEGTLGTVRARATAAGDALLDAVARAPGRLNVTAEGFRPHERDLHAFPDGPLEVRLTPAPSPQVVVRVSDSGGTPIPNAVVYVDLQDGAEDDAAATTGPDGEARFEVQRPNAVRVTAWAPGYTRASIAVALRDAADGPFSIALQREGRSR